ncbi:MAG: NADH-quinone oxidoreductase subunit C [Spirochaetota bacterium]
MENVVSTIKNTLADRILEIREISPRQNFISVSHDHIYDVTEYLFSKMGGRLATVSGVDCQEAIDILYHFCFDSRGQAVTVKTKLGKSNLKIRSITPFLPGAEWIEREIHDLLGVEFIDHPNLKRLILADDWPEGVYPLRKDQTQ